MSAQLESPIDRAASALWACDPGVGRDHWIRIGMAAKAAGLSFDDFNAWSEQAGNYGGVSATMSAWRSFKDGGVGEATLFAAALAAGWSDDASAPLVRPATPAPAAKPKQAPRHPVADVWAASVPATSDHPYIVRKAGNADGLRVYPANAPTIRIGGHNVAGWLVVPMRDVSGNLKSVQFIPGDAGAKKLNLPGHQVDGYFATGALQNGEPAFVCEGIGAAWSASKATGKTALVAFGSGNQRKVAQSAKDSGTLPVIVADAGKEADCERTAKALGCAWCAMPAGMAANGDLNDIEKDQGVEAVRALLEGSAVRQRPSIETRNGERSRIVAELAAALAASAPYYRRDAMLVRAITLPADEEISGVFRSRGSVLLRPAKAQAVIADASRVVDIVKFDKRANKLVVCDLPGDVAQSFVELGVEQQSLPSIVGVVRCPVMREDGTLQARSGYDIQTQLILAGDEDWSALTVPERPTRDDARTALKWLLSTAYADFPYADDASKAVAVSSLLTAIIRPAIGCAPVHAFSAPQFGAGKSLQASFAAIVATGQKPAMLSPGHDQSEFEKRVDAAIIQADPVVIVDNVSRALTGDNLCAALTSDRATVRPLGSSIPLQVRTSAFWMATGQNLSVKKDMHRRTVISYVDARMERPETRSGFAIADLPSWAAENRMRILSAVYTMLRAHSQAGFPSEGEKLLGNFETWSRRVANCLVWLGMVNPVRSQERLREDDPEITNRASLFLELVRWQDEWELRTSRRAWTLNELNDAATSVMTPQRELAAAIAVGVFNGVSGLSYWLRSHKNVIVETTDDSGADVAYRLEANGKARGGVVRWEVKPMD